MYETCMFQIFYKEPILGFGADLYSSSNPDFGVKYWCRHIWQIDSYAAIYDIWKYFQQE